jgi:hypothetical protein
MFSFGALNPSFRIYEADKDTKLLTNYFQYGFNVIEANLYTDSEPNWKVRYNANEFFELENLYDYKGIKKIFDSFETNNDKYKEYMKHYWSEGPAYENDKDNMGNKIF